jgi:acetyl-CoA carboxylase carboxyltransferase component
MMQWRCSVAFPPAFFAQKRAWKAQMQRLQRIATLFDDGIVLLLNRFAAHAGVISQAAKNFRRKSAIYR